MKSGEPRRQMFPAFLHAKEQMVAKLESQRD
jgi:hypothetical protein